MHIDPMKIRTEGEDTERCETNRKTACPHYTLLDESICNLENLEDELQRLLDDLIGDREPPEEREDRPQPVRSLYEVLSAGAVRVDESHARCNKIISQIREVLNV